MSRRLAMVLKMLVSTSTVLQTESNIHRACRCVDDLLQLPLRRLLAAAHPRRAASAAPNLKEGRQKGRLEGRQATSTAAIEACCSQSITTASRIAVSRAAYAPRHLNLLDPVLPALRPRYVGDQNRAVLAGVQMAPPPLTAS